MGSGWGNLRILGFPMAVVFGFVEVGERSAEWTGALLRVKLCSDYKCDSRTHIASLNSWSEGFLRSYNWLSGWPQSPV